MVVTGAWNALADPTRRAVLDLLRQGPLAVGELASALDLGQPSASKHLRVLREVGLVRVLPEAQRRIYTLAPEGFLELDEWLAPYRRLWNDALDALSHQLDEEDST